MVITKRINFNTVSSLLFCLMISQIFFIETLLGHPGEHIPYSNEKPHITLNGYKFIPEHKVLVFRHSPKFIIVSGSFINLPTFDFDLTKLISPSNVDVQFQISEIFQGEGNFESVITVKEVPNLTLYYPGETKTRWSVRSDLNNEFEAYTRSLNRDHDEKKLQLKDKKISKEEYNQWLSSKYTRYIEDKSKLLEVQIPYIDNFYRSKESISHYFEISENQEYLIVIEKSDSLLPNHFVLISKQIYQGEDKDVLIKELRRKRWWGHYKGYDE